MSIWIEGNRTVRARDATNAGAVVLSRRSAMLALVSVGALAACGKQPAPGGAGGRTRIVYGEQRATQLIAQASKAMDGTPYHFEWATFATPSVEFEAFRAGALDLASSNDVTVLNAIASGLELKVVGIIRATALMKGVGIVVQGGSPLHKVADLKDRRIVVSSARGGSGDNLLHGALREVNVPSDGIDISYAPFPDALSAFVSGDIETLVTNDPYLLLAEQHGGRILRNGDGLNSGLALIVASKAALEDPGKRAAIRDVLSRLASAGRWCLEHPDTYAAVFAQATGVTPALAQQIVQRGSVAVEPVSQAAIDIEQKVADDLVERGLWPKHVDLAPAFDRTLFQP